MSSPPKYIKVFICLRSPWALFIMPVIEFLCENVLWKPLISWVFSRLSWHLTNFVITQIVQGGSTFFLVNETSRSVTIERNPVTGQCVSEQKLFTLSRALYYNDSKWRHQCKKKKNSSCHSVAWYHWISLKIGCICFLISNSVGNVNFHIFNFHHTAILLKLYNWTELIWIFA